MDLKAFTEFCEKEKIEYVCQEPMCCHTSFKIGGPADIFVTIKNCDELKNVILQLKKNEIPYMIIGKGSNLLVSDKGIEGAVISLSKLDEISVLGQEIKVGAGAKLALLCKAALDNSLSGLEFGFGIPGAVGGAVYMNAGAYGGEIKDCIVSCEYLDVDGEIKTIKAEDMALGYRTSIFKSNDKIILSATFKLEKGDKTLIKAKMEDFLSRRKEKQPLEYPSAGSTFKRPEGHFAGALIEKNNLKGVTVGGAQVSCKHAGFVINKGSATAEDVLNLIEKIKETVLRNDNVELCTEVIFVGRK